MRESRRPPSFIRSPESAMTRGSFLFGWFGASGAYEAAGSSEYSNNSGTFGDFWDSEHFTSQPPVFFLKCPVHRRFGEKREVSVKNTTK